MARFNARRSLQVRKPLPLVLIVCDDERTAPAYFAELRSLFRQRCSIQVVPVPHDADRVIGRAEMERRKLSDDDHDTLWSLVDLEMAPDSDARIAALRRRADTAGVTLLLSQPCFEVWTLAHFVSTGQHFANCDRVLREVKKQWESAFAEEFPQKKAQADYRKLMDRLDSAVRNAKPHSSRSSQSWTEVWKLVEYVLGLEAST